jgi:photosynthetic reaction center cytochrome c subunit
MTSHRLRWAASMVVAAGIVPLFAGGIGSLPVGRAAAADSASTQGAKDSAADSANFDVTAAVAELRKKIAGRENAPSDSVWKNIKVLKQMPAGRLLNVMQQGYSKALGVNCLHCHVAGEWDSDKKRPKQVARDMMAMNGKINNELLKAIPNLQSEKPVINCTTCHRGQVKPALDLAAPAPKAGG